MRLCSIQLRRSGSKPFRSADVFKDDVRSTADVLHQPRLHDVAMLFKANPRDRLLHEAGDGALVVEKAALEALEGDRLALFVIVAEVDDAHAAAPHVGDLVAPFDAVADHELVVGSASHVRRQGGDRYHRFMDGFESRGFVLGRQRIVLQPGFAQEFLLAAGRCLPRTAEIGDCRFALEDAVAVGGIAIGDGEVVGALIALTIALGQIGEGVGVNAAVLVGNRPERDGEIAPGGVGAGGGDQPRDEFAASALGAAAVEVVVGSFGGAAVSDQRFSGVEHEQALIVRQRQARTQIAERERVVNIAAPQCQPSERAHLAVGIGRKRIALVKRVRAAERLFLLIGGQVDGQPTSLWRFRDHDTLPRFLDFKSKPHAPT